MNGFFVLIDQAKTFDRVNHEYLFMTMEALGFKGDFLELTRMLYKGHNKPGHGEWTPDKQNQY